MQYNCIKKQDYPRLSVHRNVLEKQFLPSPRTFLEQALPAIESSSKRIRTGTIIPAKGETKLKVAFFAGCIMDSMMSRINRLTIELLTIVGCEVIILKIRIAAVHCIPIKAK